MCQRIMLCNRWEDSNDMPSFRSRAASFEVQLYTSRHAVKCIGQHAALKLYDLA